jgi:hypothetical protein
MKTIKSILIAATLISASLVSTLSAQDATVAPYQFRVAVGDSVMIKRECQQYSTGERPSTWVWDKVHTVRQLGTQRYPDGVLLMSIYSWICDTCLVNVSGNAAETASEAATEQAEEKAAFERGTEPATVKPEEGAAVKPEEPATAKSEEGAAVKPEESATVKSEEGAAAAEAAAIAAAEEARQAEEARHAEEARPADAETRPAEEEATALRAAEDSIKSVQHFKHNYDRFTIGLRGGASALMHHAEQGKWNCGGDVVLDLQYAHYWADDSRKVDLGIIAGLGIGYHQSGLSKDAEHTEYDRTTGTSNVHYTVDIKDIKETDHQLQLEVPVMFSLIHNNGLFFNIGPKFMIPVWTPYKQTANVDETSIAAYFQETGITVIDQTLTGKYTGQEPEEKNGIQFNINVMLTAEIGYEWILKSGNSLGLGAYANYSVYNSYKNTTNKEGLFNLTAPASDGSSVAKLDVLSATHAYTDKLGYFDAGIKLAYHFNFPKKRYFKDSKLF